MAEFVAYAKGIQVRGTIIKATIDGMGVFKKAGFEILSEVEFDDLILIY